MAKLLFQLSREHPNLPEAELLAVLSGVGLKYEMLEKDAVRGLFLVEIRGGNTDFATRLALAQKVVKVVSIGKGLDSVSKEIYPKIKNAKSFSVRCESNTVERELGALLHEKGLNVDLTKPEKTVTVVKFKNRFVAGFEIPLEKSFDLRHPLKRPFFHPTSMKPKSARILVNLANVKKGDKVLDPFCGAGGILLEASLMGMNVFGWDLDWNMMDGCRRNLRHYGVKSSLERHDALARDKIKVDAVVTDPPYGKSSSTLGLSPSELYNRFIGNIEHNLKKGGMLAMVLPEQYKPKHAGFILENKFKIRVHKSLTRVIWILKRE